MKTDQSVHKGSRSEPGYLVLETGEVFGGQLVGGVERAGEVVFNTSHCGYEEMATDPSYYNQILVMTAPMQGNYGKDAVVWESDQMHIRGFVCVDMQDDSWDSSWRNQLISHDVSLLSGVDTRSLVLLLREQGTIWGALVRSASQSMSEVQKKAMHCISASRKVDKDWSFMVARKNILDMEGQCTEGPRVAVVDLGCKKNIIRELLKRSRCVRVFPPRSDAESILAWKPDGVLLSNGPGDPTHVEQTPGIVRDLLGKVAIFGICMGHQILALALGGRTYKLKFGHRGSNHPVRDTLTRQIYVTSQNHGYAVAKDSLPSHVQITHTNLNDQTVEGFISQQHRCMGIQFHPESHPGPHEANVLFDLFIQKLKKSL